MRIIIKDPITSAETVLCDGPGRGLDKNVGPLNEGVLVDDQVIFQVAEGCRWESVKVFNRKNRRTSTTFRISRECSSSLAAHSWRLEFHGRCIRFGTIIMTETSGSGVAKTIRIENAGLNFKPTPMGVSTLIDFNIIGGPLTI